MKQGTKRHRVAASPLFYVAIGYSDTKELKGEREAEGETHKSHRVDGEKFRPKDKGESRGGGHGTEYG